MVVCEMSAEGTGGVAEACLPEHREQAALSLADQLASAGLIPHIVDLPDGHDPNSYFVAGATAADFRRCLASGRRQSPRSQDKKVSRKLARLANRLAKIKQDLGALPNAPK